MNALVCGTLRAIGARTITQEPDSRFGRGSRQDRSHADKRGRNEAESLDGDESEPIIDDVMVRVALHLVSRRWGPDAKSGALSRLEF